MNQIPKIMTGYANANCPKCGKLNITNPPHECVAPASQIPNIEEEYRYYQAPNVPIAKVFAQTNDGTKYELKEVNHHQQLQKARQDWLREEIVKLERMKKLKNAHLGTAMPADEVLIQCENAGWNRARQTIIDRYQKELDRPDDEDYKGGTCSKCGMWKGGSYGINGDGVQSFHRCHSELDQSTGANGYAQDAQDIKGSSGESGISELDQDKV